MSLANIPARDLRLITRKQPSAMLRAFRRARRASVLAAAACSFAAGWGALYIAVTPDTIGVVSTPVLLGALGLFAFPLALLILVGVDRGSRRSTPPASEDPPLSAGSTPAAHAGASHASGREAGLASRAHRVRAPGRSSATSRA